MVLTQACINMICGPETYNRLVDKSSKSPTYHNTDFDKSYGFYSSMTTYREAPKCVIRWLVTRQNKNYKNTILTKFNVFARASKNIS